MKSREFQYKNLNRYLVTNTNDYKVPAQIVWARICLSVNFIEYLTIIPWARVGYEMVNSQRGE